MQHKKFCLLIVAFVWTAWHGTAFAQMSPNIAIHGFGGWAYGQTDNDNHYLVGNEDGNYDSVNFSLNITATPYENLSLHVQTAYNEGIFEDEDVTLDYAFAEWYISDLFSLRIGKVKAPFLLSTEVYDVGTLRPFFTLPQGAYQELAAEAYKGLGITGSLYNGESWGVQYDLYGGKLEIQQNPILNLQTGTFATLAAKINKLFGGRVLLQTPVTGLNFGFSAYGGMAELDITGIAQQVNTDEDSILLFSPSVEYQTDRWWLRAEYLMQRNHRQLESDIVYAEAAYKFTSHWQTALRYEWADFQVTTPDAAYYPSSFFKHKEVALGMNYWFNPNLVVKVSYHIVDGNRFAYPEDSTNFCANLQQGRFDDPTRLLVFGVQFSF